jgi:hypothetical protein
MSQNAAFKQKLFIKNETPQYFSKYYDLNQYYTLISCENILSIIKHPTSATDLVKQ